jgi:hypothetical protein
MSNKRNQIRNDYTRDPWMWWFALLLVVVAAFVILNTLNIL